MAKPISATQLGKGHRLLPAVGSGWPTCFAVQFIFVQTAFQANPGRLITHHLLGLGGAGGGGTADGLLLDSHFSVLV